MCNVDFSEVPVRPCIEPDCPRLTRGTRCAEHQRQHDRARNARRTHYQGDYRKRAKQVRDSAVLCHLCGQGARPGDPWTADHVRPGDPTSPLRPAHKSCNSRRGNR